MAIQANPNHDNLLVEGGRASNDYVNASFGFNHRILSDNQLEQQQFMQQQYAMLHTLQQRNQNLYAHHTSLLPQNNRHYQAIMFPPNVTAHLEKQTQELDGFICLQVRNYGVYMLN